MILITIYYNKPEERIEKIKTGLISFFKRGWPYVVAARDNIESVNITCLPKIKWFLFYWRRKIPYSCLSRLGRINFSTAILLVHQMTLIDKDLSFHIWKK